MNPHTTDYYESLLNDKDALIDALSEANDQLKAEITDLKEELAEVRSKLPNYQP